MEDREFDEFVTARWSRLVRAAVMLGCSPAEAEDVVQTALVRCLRHWGKVRDADDIDAYVHQILLNVFRSSRGRRWSQERPVPSVPVVEVPDASSLVDATSAVLSCLTSLTQDQRVAVILRYYVNLTEAQMAEVLQVRPGTVKSRLSRALAALSQDPQLIELGGNT